MNSKMTTNSQLSTTEPKTTKKSKVSKQLEQERNHRNGAHMEGYQHRSVLLNIHAAVTIEYRKNRHNKCHDISL